MRLIPTLLDRHSFLLGVLGMAGAAAHSAKPSDDDIIAIERRAGGRLGVLILDTDNGVHIGNRENERFALCSTFKWIAAAAVLARVDAGTALIDQRVRYRRSDLLDYSPVTSANVAQGYMTLGALCAAAVRVSDNTAANLMLEMIGGPAGLTRYIRSLGDPVTRLDRTEPDLNEAAPGDVRDTTSPAAMVALMRRVFLGNALSGASRTQLEAWMRATTTGDNRLRAGLPAGWIAGDKTGTCGHNATNDVAIVRPPRRGPLLIAAYFTESPIDAQSRDAVLAQIGALAARLS
jgi:beta-lactamase class A